MVTIFDSVYAFVSVCEHVGKCLQRPETPDCLGATVTGGFEPSARIAHGPHRWAISSPHRPFLNSDGLWIVRVTMCFPIQHFLTIAIWPVVHEIELPGPVPVLKLNVVGAKLSFQDTVSSKTFYSYRSILSTSNQFSVFHMSFQGSQFSRKHSFFKKQNFKIQKVSAFHILSLNIASQSPPSPPLFFFNVNAFVYASIHWILMSLGFYSMNQD